MKTATYSSPSNRYLNTVHGLTLSRAFMLFLFLSISFLGLSLGDIMVFKVDTLIKENPTLVEDSESFVNGSIKDVFSTENSEIRNLATELTVMDGKIIFQR